MRTIKLDSRFYEVRDNETVLSALLRHGVNISFSCTKGSCTVCLHKCSSGSIPATAQRGLKPEIAEKGYFLPCICYPTDDMYLEHPRAEDLCFGAEVAGKDQLSHDVCRIFLEPEIDLQYRAGQFINILRSTDQVRSYSVASVYGEVPFLELHVQRITDGVVSGWLHDDVAIGERLTISGPFGTNFYRAAEPGRPLILIGSGTGLAPLLGIIRHALISKHQADIHFFLAGGDPDDLYLNDELLRLADENDRFFYHPHLTSATTGYEHITAKHEIADCAFLELEDRILEYARIHAAGQPATIERCMSLAEAAGIDPGLVMTDEFFTRGRISVETSTGKDAILHKETGPRRFKPDAEMWQALEEGKLLAAILNDFYTRVFEDPLLLPYFHNVTKERVIEKVYSYLRQVFTGERRYFGEHPRNAHHWMVIDNALFDHRERLLAECMAKHGLPDHLIERWQFLEEQFRFDIVKSEPWGRIVDGVELPLGSFTQEELEISMICDGCQSEIAAGETVHYHQRLGTIYGRCCSASVAEARLA